MWDMDLWNYESCTAEICDGGEWATLYSIVSYDRNKWHAQQLLADAKKYYEDKWKVFWWSVALNPIMKHIYQKLKIKEYVS